MTTHENTAGWLPDQLERKRLLEQGRAVVASKRNVGLGVVRDDALIGWASRQGKVVLIDRTTRWGNPFVRPRDGDRVQVIAKYEQHLSCELGLRAHLTELKGKVLLCWCYPKPCHGDVLAQEVNDG